MKHILTKCQFAQGRIERAISEQGIQDYPLKRPLNLIHGAKMRQLSVIF